MISKQLLDKAAAVLPKCKTLNDAERQLGGEWDESKMKRDDKAAAITWGLFDSWVGRPFGKACNGYDVLYNEAYDVGRKLSMMELPG